MTCVFYMGLSLPLLYWRLLKPTLNSIVITVIAGLGSISCLSPQQCSGTARHGAEAQCGCSAPGAVTLITALALQQVEGPGGVMFVIGCPNAQLD